MKKILFIYGYGGSPQSNTCHMLRSMLPEDQFEVLCPTYPQEDCAKAIEFLTQFIEQEDINIVAGTSLGSFIALALPTDKPKFVINPCMKPAVELPKLNLMPDLANGALPSQEMIDTYAPFEQQLFAENHLDQSITGFFAEADELLGTKYVDIFNEQFGEAHLVPGGHRANQQAAQAAANAIIEFCSHNDETENLTQPVASYDNAVNAQEVKE